MPTYEYECLKCYKHFERFKKISEISDITIELCPECNSSSRRLISGGTGIIFKGSGFYCNDYSKSGKVKKEEEAKEIEKSKII